MKFSNSFKITAVIAVSSLLAVAVLACTLGAHNPYAEQFLDATRPFCGPLVAGTLPVLVLLLVWQKNAGD